MHVYIVISAQMLMSITQWSRPYFQRPHGYYNGYSIILLIRAPLVNLLYLLALVLVEARKAHLECLYINYLGPISILLADEKAWIAKITVSVGDSCLYVGGDIHHIQMAYQPLYTSWHV